MNIDQYIKKQLEKLDQYLSGVKSGKIKTNRWIKLAVKRYEKDLKRKDLIFNKQEIEYVLQFFYLININHDNEYTRFEPLGYQVFIVANLFGFFYSGAGSGWYESGFRRYSLGR